MNLSLPNAVTARASRLVLKTKKHSPAILLAAGITAGVGTVVTACRATLQVEDVLVGIQKDKLKVQEASGLNLQNYTDSDARKDLTIIYIQGAVKLAKLYGPAFVLGVTSVTCLTQSHRILTNRNAALAAAYTAVDKAFDQYRGRVREDQGEDKDREYLFGKEVSTETVEGKDGKTKQVKRTHAGPGGTKFARFFGEDNINYSTAPEYNVAYLRGCQMMWNQRLQAKGHLFLNEIYDDLGIERSAEGQTVGYLKEKGDFVDLGIWGDDTLMQMHDFVLGREGIWLDFPGVHLMWDQI